METIKRLPPERFVMEQLWHAQSNAKPKKPSEIPQPGKEPETIPTEEPGPPLWPQREPEIQPEKEPLTTPPLAPPEVPAPPQSTSYEVLF